MPSPPCSSLISGTNASTTLSLDLALKNTHLYDVLEDPHPPLPSQLASLVTKFFIIDARIVLPIDPLLENIRLDDIKNMPGSPPISHIPDTITQPTRSIDADVALVIEPLLQHLDVTEMPGPSIQLQEPAIATQSFSDGSPYLLTTHNNKPPPEPSSPTYYTLLSVALA